MNYAFAVIGAGWGDEGKGLATDAIAHRLSQDRNAPVRVVRSNGGAQAGHGVERPGHIRHVFHHIGAGTLSGASTHLSQFFVAHPMLLGQEVDDLAKIGFAPRAITIDPRAPVTTPWDMAINQSLEIARGMMRHGSTGLGFGETIQRMENGPTLTARDLWNPDLGSILKEIRDDWSVARMDDLGIEDMGGRDMRQIFDTRTGILEMFLSNIAYFKNQVRLMDDADVANDARPLFEGAQGLRLDMDQGEMPHVTRSNTGLKNMLAIAEEAGIEMILPHYMTRAYATRHGAGPLPHETFNEHGTGQDLEWAEVIDETNAPNTWQGHIRQAVLDLDILKASIDYDLELASNSAVIVSPYLGVTCLDQVKMKGKLAVGGEHLAVDVQDIPDRIGEHAELSVSLTSYGPCREDVRWRRSGPEVAAVPGFVERLPDPA